MTWRGLGRCAALALLLGLAGCAIDSVNARLEEKQPNGDSAVVTGSADQVAVNAQAILQGLGLSAELKRDGSDLRLACSTAKGKHFNLHLVEKPTPTGVETHLRLEWEDGPDDPLAVRVLAGLAGLRAP